MRFMPVKIFFLPPVGAEVVQSSFSYDIGDPPVLTRAFGMDYQHAILSSPQILFHELSAAPSPQFLMTLAAQSVAPGVWDW